MEQTSEQLADALNNGDWRARLDRGEVTLEHRDTDDEATDEELTALGNPELYADEHPEGADRGGYVLYAEVGNAKAYYDQLDGTWVC